MTDFDAGRTPDAPQSHDLRLLSALAGDLARLDYTVDGVAALLGPEAYEAFGRDQLVPALQVTGRQVGAGKIPGQAAGLAAVVRLWLLGRPVPEQAVAAALPATGAAGLQKLGLAEAEAGQVRALADLRPYASEDLDLWVASDLGAHQRPGVLRHDHVLGIGQASLTLAQLTVRAPVDRALDLGTGCGIQAFHLLSHARHVTATDISVRALAFTRFNLLLNAGRLGLVPERLQERVSLRLGSLLEPVAGERFDLVVSNPPFVITPRSAAETAADQFTYRDGGLPGDDIVARLVAGLPGVLVPGGTAQLLGNWEIRQDGGEEQPWHRRLEGWLSPDTEAWIIQRERLSPAQYAETWLRDAAENRDAEHYEHAYAAYLEDFVSRQVSGIGFGMIWLRRAADGGAGRLRRFEEITYPIEQPIGPHLAAAVERHDWLRAHAADFAQQHLCPAGDVTEERHQRPGAEHPGVILLRQGAGLRRTNLMSSELAGFVAASDGELPVGRLVAALETLVEDPGEEFAERLTGQVRNLVEDGYLVPAEAPGRAPTVPLPGSGTGS
ncbi:methyltransferase [Arthrobacter sp. I2-34]|uniref:Methyltransferase n=1 Tax=Arthrobacter hankyongi TaxID=2904801 RepID=A0ABS9LA14_9MICC|nr:methyltransferase [Arthrobacter hankyongi]MCG2623522.1 methyltransferase [Arthrobacter hankyongi]